jgi:hypothetical protein
MVSVVMDVLRVALVDVNRTKSVVPGEQTGG